MSKYEDWINTALTKLDRDFCNGEFLPRNEHDITSHLWHCLLSTKQQIDGLDINHQLTREYHSKGRKYNPVDLAIIKSIDINHYGLRTLIEIKEISTNRLSQEKIHDIEYDIEKMKTIIKYYEDKKRNGYKYLRSPCMVFFCRGASKQGMGLRVNRELEKLSKRHNGINFWWGPKCT